MSRLLGLWYSVRTTFRRAEAEREAREEMEFHLERQARKHIAAGLPEADAQRLARREFGGVTNWREATREARHGRVIESLVRDARYALRGLARARGHTAVTIATLTVAIGSATVAFSLVRGVLLAGLPFPNADRIVGVYEAGETIPTLPLSVPNFLDWKAASRTLDRMAAAFQLRVAVGTAAAPVIVDAAQVSDEFFDVFGVPAALGRTIARGDGDAGGSFVVLSDDFWRGALGADSSVIGRPLPVGVQQPTVIGIMPASFRYPAGVKLWLSRSLRNAGPRNVIGEEVTGRLAPGATVAQAQAELAGIAAAIHRTYPDTKENQAVSATVHSLRDDIIGPARPLIVALASAVGLLLFIGCVNVAAGNLARTLARRHELALRIALGASRSRLVRQLVTESLIVTVGSGVIGIMLAYWIVRAIPSVAPSSLPRLMVLTLDLRVMMFGLAVSLAVGLVVGLAPLWRLPLGDLRGTIVRGARAGGGGAATGRAALIAAEVAMAMVLLVGAGLCIRTLRLLLDRDNGFVGTNVLTVETRLPPKGYGKPARAARFYDALIAAVRAIPGVTSVAGTSAVPLSVAGMGFVTIEGHARSTDGPDIAGYRLVTNDFFRTLGIPILAGRTFSPADDSTSQHVTVISVSMARKYWPDESPLGKRFKAESFDDHATVWLTVIGVVPDIRYWTLEAETVPEHYVTVAQRPERAYNFSLLVKTAVPPTSLVPAVRQAITEHDPDVAANFQTMDQRVAASAVDRRFMMLTFTSLAWFALLLVAIGVYGVFSYLVTQRTREIGVRMAIGADRWGIAALVVRSALRPVAAGAALGTAGALGLSGVMRSLVYGIDTHDPASYIAAAAALVGVALLATLVPAHRAAGVDPMISLRAD